MFMGILACMFSLTTLNPEAIILLWLMSFLLDFDVLLEAFQKNRKNYFLSHKAGSHSYIIGLIFSGIISLIVSPITNASFLMIWFGGFLGYSIHVSLDLFTASKIPIFYPISKKEFRLIADRAINPGLAAFSGINTLILIGFYYAGANYYTFMDLARLYLIIYSSYFGFRAFMRIYAHIKLPNSHHYIPGFVPFFYLVYENQSSTNNVTFKLTKNSVFSSKKTEILNKQLINDSVEMKFYEMAKNISHNYRFFHKWNAIIPFIRENEDSINIVLMLAEGFSKMRSYFLSVVFHKTSKQVISKTEEFGSIKKWESNNF